MPAHIDPAAFTQLVRLLLGDPNTSLSSKDELRYGSRGSLSVDLRKCTWYDHEANEGGGALDLVTRETKLSGAARVEWLTAHRLDGVLPDYNGGGPQARASIVATYPYCDETGALLFEVVRFARPKDFRQRRPDGKGGWTWSVKGVRRVPYRLPELLEAGDRVVFIVEGEADADRLRALGIPATTNAGGAGKWKPELSEFFRDSDVVIVPDHDPQKLHPKTREPLFHPDGRPMLPGQDHAQAVAQALHGVAKRVRVLELWKSWPQMPPKGDISDWLKDGGGTAEKLYALVETLPDWSPTQAEPEQTETDARPEPPPEPEPPLPALPYIDITEPIRPREWLVPDRVPARNVTLLSGEGAIGKSLLLFQLSAAVVLGRDWIGTLPTYGPVLYVNCEEDGNEARTRLEDIAKLYDTTRTDLQQAGLHMTSFAGSNAVLAVADHLGRIQTTPLFASLKQDALAIRPKLIVLDTSADIFLGNENDRTQTRQFITLLRGLALEADAAVILSSHPSLTGLKSESGLSGSTAWHNSVRARMYFKTATDDDPTLRVLEVKKSNYGPISENILLRWKNGVYIREPRTGSMEKLSAEINADMMFLFLLRRHTREGRNVTDKTGTSYAPAIFAKEREAKAAKISKDALGEAMLRLFAANRIKVIGYGPPSKMRTRIVEVEGEQDASTDPSTDPPTDLPPPSTGVCSPPPHTPPVGGRWKGSVEADPPSTDNPGGARRYRVIGPTEAKTVCVKCHSAEGEVLKIKRDRPGAKTETLHEACAAGWFTVMTK